MLPGLAAAAAAHRCSWSSLCRLRLRCRAVACGSSDLQGECPAPASDSAEAGLEDKAGLGSGRLASGVCRLALSQPQNLLVGPPPLQLSLPSRRRPLQASLILVSPTIPAGIWGQFSGRVASRKRTTSFQIKHYVSMAVPGGDRPPPPAASAKLLTPQSSRVFWAHRLTFFEHFDQIDFLTLFLFSYSQPVLLNFLRRNLGVATQHLRDIL